MSYRDRWTADHGADGLRPKFHVYKAADRWAEPPSRMVGGVAYDESAELSSTGEFVFVLRPEADKEAWEALHLYACRVAARSPQLAADMHLRLEAIRERQEADMHLRLEAIRERQAVAEAEQPKTVSYRSDVRL